MNEEQENYLNEYESFHVETKKPLKPLKEPMVKKEVWSSIEFTLIVSFLLASVIYYVLVGVWF